MKKKGPTHAERRESARPAEWKPQPRVPKIPYEPPKPVKQTAKSHFSASDIERLKQREAQKQHSAPATKADKTLTVNLEQGMPLTETALRRMHTSLQGASVKGIKEVRFIHGYGSTGNGGAIKEAVRRELPQSPYVKSIIRGEELPGANPGVTVAIMK